MVGDNPAIELPAGQIIKTRVLARDPADDLVLLLPEKTISEGINLYATERDSVSVNDLGKFLISPLPGSPYRTGIIGTMRVSLPQITSYGYIGATTALIGDNLVFTVVNPGSAAETGGLKVGDQIVKVDGHQVEDQLDFLKALRKYRAGDSTEISIVRTSKVYTKTVVLKYPPQKKFNHPAEMFPGGKSLRRDGFDNVFIHDTRLQPSDCGGPLFDIEGHFRGVNIARLSRTSTLATPALTIKQFVKARLK